MESWNYSPATACGGHLSVNLLRQVVDWIIRIWESLTRSRRKPNPIENLVVEIEYGTNHLELGPSDDPR